MEPTTNFRRISALMSAGNEQILANESHRDVAILVSSDFTQNDLGNADRLVAHCSHILRHTPQTGWMAFDGRRWNRGTGAAKARNFANEVARAISEECQHLGSDKAVAARAAWAKQSGQNARIKAMLETAEPDLSTSIDDFDKDENMMCLVNGVVDLRTGDLHAHAPEQMMSLLAGSSFDPKDRIECPLWEKFLDDIMCGDTEIVRFLQRAIGYSMFATAREQVAFFLTGDEEHKKQNGSNGKSLFLSILQAVMGEYATTVTRTLIVEKNHEGISNDVAKLKGKRVAFGSEFKRKDIIAAEQFKRLTGDENVEARFLHKEYFEFLNLATLWFATNYLPLVSDQDDGVWRRMVIIPFRAKFWPKETCPKGGKVKDNTLKERLMKGLPGILQWCIDGAMAYAAEGRLVMPEQLFAQREAKQVEFDPLRDFMQACVEQDPEATTPAVDFRRAYERFCEMNGMEPMSVTAFGRRMNEEGLVKDEALTKARGSVHRRGARLSKAGLACASRNMPALQDMLKVA